MSGLTDIFTGGPDIPEVGPAPLPPFEDPKMIAKQQKAALDEARAASSGGRASTIFTSPLGDTSQATTASKLLLGQ